MATSISAILVPCLKTFNQLQEQVERPDYSCEGEVSSVSWGDKLGRLRLWAANIGAHQTGQSSLDFRLRDASHISKQITKLLQDLAHCLHDVMDELSKDGTNASEDDETSAAWPDDDSTTELQQLHEEVVNVIDCLYQLSMLIRKPAQHDLLVGSRMSDKAEFEFYDLEHVRNLHPRTEDPISQRLGRAITRRRKYFNYRERHHRKLEKGIEEVQGIQGIATESVISETIATDFKIHNIDFEETSSNSGMSQTSYAPSLIDGGRVTIPPPPKESSGGKPFECPYCFFVIDIKSTRSWSRHIFKDIKPYVCTFTDCSVPDRLYDSRREWYLHETTEHRRDGFLCVLCRDTLNSSKQYERHVARHLEELALFALPRTEMDDVEDDEDDVFDTRALSVKYRAFAKADGVTVDNVYSSYHSDHSSLASVTDDDDSMGGLEYPDSVDVEAFEERDDGWKFEDPGEPIEEIFSNSASKPRNSNEQRPFVEATRTEEARRPSFSRPLSPEPGADGSSDVIIPRPGRDRWGQRQISYYQDRSRSAGAAAAGARRPAPIEISNVQHRDPTIHHNLGDQSRGSRSPSQYYDYELERKMKKLEELEEKEMEDVAREKFEEEQLLRKVKKDKAKQEAVKARVKKTLVEAGYDEERIEKVLMKGEEGEKHGNERGKTKIADLTRPTYIKVHRKHVSPETLDEFNLPWEWNEVNNAFLFSFY